MTELFRKGLPVVGWKSFRAICVAVPLTVGLAASEQTVVGEGKPLPAPAQSSTLPLGQQALRRAEQVGRNAEQAIRAADEALTASKKLLQEVEESLARLLADDQARRRRDEEVYYTVSNKNFVVGAVGRSFSEAILAKAEQFRREQAQAFGIELDQGGQFVIIHVTLSDDVDRGRTLLGDKRRGFAHRIWLTTSRKLALGTTLAHEILHIVLQSRFPGGMPAWANEGLASQLDDEERHAIRDRILAGFVRKGKFPSVAFLMNSPRLAPSDQASYAAVVSLTKFLLGLNDEQHFLAFVEQGQRTGWDSALKQFYRLEGTKDLQSRWESFLRKQDMR